MAAREGWRGSLQGEVDGGEADGGRAGRGWGGDINRKEPVKRLAPSGADEARARLAAGKRAIDDPSDLPSVGQLPYDRGA